MSAGKYTCTYCDSDHADRCVNLACPIGYHNVLSTKSDECIGESPIHSRLC
jgi:hypothetical protein